LSVLPLSGSVSMAYQIRRVAKLVLDGWAVSLSTARREMGGIDLAAQIPFRCTKCDVKHPPEATCRRVDRDDVL